jgi:hypothetical protein
VSISPVASITEFDVFTGASSGSNGLPGQVPKPEAGQEGFFLRGDGTWAAGGGGGGGAPADAQYFVLSADATLTQERVLAFSTAVFTASDNGAGNAYNVDLATVVTATTVGSASAIPVLTFDAYGRITSATTAAAAGGGGVNKVQATVDFGFTTGNEGDVATVTVTATWVTATSIIVCAPAGIATTDHDPEDYVIEGITAYPINIVAGVGFDIIAGARENTFGTYVINAVG